VKVREERVGR